MERKLDRLTGITTYVYDQGCTRLIAVVHPDGVRETAEEYDRSFTSPPLPRSAPPPATESRLTPPE